MANLLNAALGNIFLLFLIFGLVRPAGGGAGGEGERQRGGRQPISIYKTFWRKLDATNDHFLPRRVFKGRPHAALRYATATHTLSPPLITPSPPTLSLSHTTRHTRNPITSPPSLSHTHTHADIIAKKRRHTQNKQQAAQVDLAEFKQRFNKPVGIIIGLVCQFVFLPVAGRVGSAAALFHSGYCCASKHGSNRCVTAGMRPCNQPDTRERQSVRSMYVTSLTPGSECDSLTRRLRVHPRVLPG
jgi:hypothetical protein